MLRPADLVRGLLGTALVVQPRRTAEVAAGRPPEAVVGDLARVLGIRMLLQAAAGLAVRRRWVRMADVVVEVTHATSMLGVAAVSRRHRRTALLAGALATVLALTDLRARRPGRGGAGG